MMKWLKRLFRRDDRLSYPEQGDCVRVSYEGSRTDQERLVNLLVEFGIDFEQLPCPERKEVEIGVLDGVKITGHDRFLGPDDGPVVRISCHRAKIEGCSGFSADWCFTTDGRFLKLVLFE